MKQQTSDFDQGFGVGGLARYDMDAERAELIARGEMQVMPRQCSRGGQLWEPCPICGKEPIHLDCGLCDDCCGGSDA